MNLQTLSVADVEHINYVEFISLIRETNRCPGGKNTVRKIIQNSFINQNSNVLEIGCNTGFTSLEIARTMGCKVTGIDVVAEAIETANLVLSEDTATIQKLVSFQLGSALDLQFEDNSFDLIVCGGATSFMENKQAAISEYHRVLKPWGMLSVTNLCYINPPPQKTIDAVSKIIGVNIKPWTAEQWMDVFLMQKKFETYLLEKYQLFPQEPEIINSYIDYFMNKGHLSQLNNNVQEAIRKRWMHTIDVFNENHKYLGFILALLRKDHIHEEPELFSKSSPYHN